MLAYCSRCEGETSASHNNPGLRRWARVYFILGTPFIPLFPIIGSDFAVMLPLTMVYLLGMGTALRVLREPASCDTCGADVERAKPAKPTPA